MIANRVRFKAMLGKPPYKKGTLTSRHPCWAWWKEANIFCMESLSSLCPYCMPSLSLCYIFQPSNYIEYISCGFIRILPACLSPLSMFFFVVCMLAIPCYSVETHHVDGQIEMYVGKETPTLPRNYIVSPDQNSLAPRKGQ